MPVQAQATYGFIEQVDEQVQFSKNDTRDDEDVGGIRAHHQIKHSVQHSRTLLGLRYNKVATPLQQRSRLDEALPKSE